MPATGPAFDTWLSRYAAFAGAAAGRFRGRAGLWEIGNEPNQHFFWEPAPDPAQYVRWYQALFDAIRAADPEARVAMGGFTGLSAGPTYPYGASALQFLDQLHTLGVRPEIVSIHPYCAGAPEDQPAWDNSFTDVQKVHDFYEARGLQIPLWITEWGWSTSGVGADNQATYVRRSLEMIRDLYPYVSVATHFLDRDIPGAYDQGLLTADYLYKPAGTAWAEFLP